MPAPGLIYSIKEKSEASVSISSASSGSYLLIPYPCIHYCEEQEWISHAGELLLAIQVDFRDKSGISFAWQKIALCKH